MLLVAVKNVSFIRKLTWADIILLTMISEYYNLKYLYTPLIKYGSDLESQVKGTFEQDLIEETPDFSNSHLYIKGSAFNGLMTLDEKGIEIAKAYAWSKPVSS